MLALQGSLFASAPGCGRRVGALPPLSGVERLDLDGGAWVDHLPGWLPASDEVFEAVIEHLAWQEHSMRMYDRVVTQPRLSAAIPEGALPGWAGLLLEEAKQALQAHYGIDLGGSWANLYRDGRDSVAWHGDRHARRLPQGVVCIVSLGGRRPFRLRPAGGGRSLHWSLGRGDLLVMGGSCQRTWQHSVPKVRHAEPRVSLTWRWPVA